MICEYCSQKNELGESTHRGDSQCICESALSELGIPLCTCCRREMLEEEEQWYEISVGHKTCL